MSLPETRLKRPLSKINARPFRRTSEYYTTTCPRRARGYFKKFFLCLNARLTLPAFPSERDERFEAGGAREHVEPADRLYRVGLRKRLEVACHGRGIARHDTLQIQLSVFHPDVPA